MLRILLGAPLFLLAPAVLGQDLSPAPVRIEITKLDCSRLVRHYPDSDVAYRPGEGARGRKVAPADLPGGGSAAMPDLLPETFEFPIIIQAARIAGVDETPLTLGVVAYDAKRRTFTFNGRPIGSEDQAALAEACAKRGVR